MYKHVAAIDCKRTFAFNAFATGHGNVDFTAIDFHRAIGFDTLGRRLVGAIDAIEVTGIVLRKRSVGVNHNTAMSIYGDVAIVESEITVGIEANEAKGNSVVPVLLVITALSSTNEMFKPSIAKAVDVPV